jgi:regulator of cell morphogenesis and NO signaling
METTQTLLDVTTLPPREKHPTIIRMFDEMNEGDILTIANDHDPKPLYYQLVSERGQIFTWEYLENGPAWWRVAIKKQNPSAERPTVGQLAASDLRKAQVFKKYGIDFCCGGRKTLTEVCTEKGLDVVKIERELVATENSATRPTNFNQWSLDFLADYIVNTHHAYVTSVLPDMKAYAAKVAAVHGSEHPELLRILDLVEAVSEELTSHMMKEERILFPYIKVLAKASKDGITPPASHFGSVNNPIQMMEAEHESAGSILQQIRELTDNYKLPAEACTSYSLLFKMLEEFESDLHIHVHLENNILFPGATELEKTFR